jgi:hypothetical protein
MGGRAEVCVGLSRRRHMYCRKARVLSIKEASSRFLIKSCRLLRGVRVSVLKGDAQEERASVLSSDLAGSHPSAPTLSPLPSHHHNLHRQSSFTLQFFFSSFCCRGFSSRLLSFHSLRGASFPWRVWGEGDHRLAEAYLCVSHSNGARHVFPPTWSV